MAARASISTLGRSWGMSCRSGCWAGKVSCHKIDSPSKSAMSVSGEGISQSVLAIGVVALG